jgi:hypothetical protein
MKRLFKDDWVGRGSERGDASSPPEDAVFGVWWRRTVVREDPWEALRREIDRSRRHRHALTLLRLGPAPRGRLDRRGREGLLSTMLSLRQLMRSVDSVWADRDGIFMLLPESDRTAADGLLQRLRETVPEAVGPEGPRVACFPADGLTANALRAAVNRSFDGPAALPVGPGQEALGPHAADPLDERRARRRAGRMGGRDNSMSETSD